MVLSTGAIYPNADAGNVGLSTTPAGAPPTATLAVLQNTTYYAFAASQNWAGTLSTFTFLGSTASLAALPTTVASTFSAVAVTSFTASWNAD